MTKFLDEPQLEGLAKQGKVDPALVRSTAKKVTAADREDARMKAMEKMLTIIGTLLKQMCQGQDEAAVRQEGMQTLIDAATTKPTHGWKFKFVRNTDGYLKEVTAERVEAWR